MAMEVKQGVRISGGFSQTCTKTLQVVLKRLERSDARSVQSANGLVQNPLISKTLRVVLKRVDVTDT